MAGSQFVIFKLDEEEFGIDIMKVREIIRLMPIVKIPNTPNCIEGIINLRDKVHPIFNMRKKFQFQHKPFDDKTKIVIIKVNGLDIGFLVDEVSEILRFEGEWLEAVPELISGIDRKYISKVGKTQNNLIILLDFDYLLSKIEMEEVEQLAD